ncbi:E3 ubiquitin-protein ligase RNF34-like isoform X1 [Asterias amurensis]|uniref:E3 ubiquitin-protein ligase RNF34-like isoform X1 n=2 Tax=Asterias amurensis TaxID=7602 RepID=UPI003AB83531
MRFCLQWCLRKAILALPFLPCSLYVSERLRSMGSGATKLAQGSSNFSGTFVQTQSPRPRSAGRPRSGTSTRSSVSLQEEFDSSVMVCELCSANFTLFKRKYKCLDCSKLFCSNCIRKEPRRSCKTCCMFTGSQDRSQLMQIKVKDLRQYLAARDISTLACREKEELVDLVVQYLSSHSNSPFMVTVNNLDEAMADTPVSHRHDSVDRSVPHGSSYNQPGTRQSDPVQQGGESEMGVTRNAWPEGSSTSDSEAEHSPVENISNPEPVNNTEPESSPPPPPPQSVPLRKRASISDLSKIEDIDDLSVRQLKEILTLNFIDYKGCVERWELEERVKRLYQEREDFKNKEQATAAAVAKVAAAIREGKSNSSESSADKAHDNTCKICMDSPIDCVLLECGHMVTCTKCGKQLAECPMCRQYIIRAVHVFRS